MFTDKNIITQGFYYYMISDHISTVVEGCDSHFSNMRECMKIKLQVVQGFYYQMITKHNITATVRGYGRRLYEDKFYNCTAILLSHITISLQ